MMVGVMVRGMVRGNVMVGSDGEGDGEVRE